MEILNRKTTPTKRGKKFVRFDSRVFIMPWKVYTEFDIGHGDYIHFVIDTDMLCFFVNKDSSGYRVTKGGNGQLQVANRDGIRKLVETFGKKILHKRLPIKKLMTRLNENQLIEIILNKRM